MPGGAFWSPLRARFRTEGFRYALDNGAWTAFQKGQAFNEAKFERAFAKLGAGADFVVAPDIVAGGVASLRVTERWLPKLGAARLVLVPAQNGMVADDVRPLLGPRVGIFLGGDTEWKLATMRAWGELARDVGCYYHVGRVNSRRRIRMCHEAGADSFDGTSVTKYHVTLPALDAETKQGGFVW